MKSPVPFLKSKSYYSSPIKTPVIKDEVVNQSNPTFIVEEPILVEEQHVIEELSTVVEEPIKKSNKKPKS